MIDKNIHDDFCNTRLEGKENNHVIIPADTNNSGVSFFIRNA